MIKDGETTTYTYDENHRLIKEETEENVITYTYDSNGNLIGKTTREGEFIYTYDFENRLISVITPTSNIQYFYDGEGNRITKEVNGVRVNFIVDNNNPTGFSQVLAEVDNEGNISADYTYGKDLIAMENSQGSFFYHYDALGSTRNLTDMAGNITDTYSYYAFGNLLSIAGGTSNPYLFTGERFDAETNFYYLRARYYDPGVGRFLSMDPFPGTEFSPITLHPYLYCQNNPVMFVDPSGEYVIDVFSQGISISSILKKFLPKNIIPSSFGTCGPDITQALKNTVQKIRNRFHSWSRPVREMACANLYSPQKAGGAWEIMELLSGKGGQLENFLKDFPECATSLCQNTVEVNGECYSAGAVNYIAFGVMSKLCHIPEQAMETAIYAWKITRYGHLPDEEVIGWAFAGYAGWPEFPIIPKSSHTRCKSCAYKAQNQDFTVLWVPHQF